METKQYPDMECDVVIAGCGVAGLYAALNLPTSTRVIMLSKGAVDECDSMLAQGGICVLPEGSDYDAFFEDTSQAFFPLSKSFSSGSVPKTSDSSFTSSM